jgi:hypothetical protein
MEFSETKVTVLKLKYTVSKRRHPTRTKQLHEKPSDSRAVLIHRTLQ